MHPKVIEFLRNSNFIQRAEIHTFALSAITQGGVVEFHIRMDAHNELKGKGKGSTGSMRGTSRGIGVIPIRLALSS